MKVTNMIKHKIPRHYHVGYKNYIIKCGVSTDTTVDTDAAAELTT